MSRASSSYFALLLAALPLPLLAQPEKFSPTSATVTLREDTTLTKALDEVRRQTGVAAAVDGDGKDAPLTLALDRVPVWRALDRIAADVKRKVVASPDGSLLLTRLQPGERLRPTSYDGDFRLRLAGIAVARDFDFDRGSCTLTLDVNWLPAVRPLFLDTHAKLTRVLDGNNRPVTADSAGFALAPVDGRPSFSLDVALPAQPRAMTQLNLVEGSVTAVVPSKFLAFRFDADLPTLESAVAGGAVRKVVEDDITCKIDRLVLGKDRWSVQLSLDYPAGVTTLESFQASSLVVQNELTLVSADGKRTLTPSGYVIDSVSTRRAQVTYHFTDRPNARLGAAKGWRPRYRAPAGVVERRVKFSFRDVRLP